ncbi:hypothetical protein JD969_16090 [Planctomycetota bacterium]|nr:hypothetical protein JD969_16090 [Planctomycetota bacterium]
MGLIQSLRGVMLLGVLAVFCTGCAIRHETNLLLDCPSPTESGYVFSVTKVSDNEVIPLPHIFNVKSDEYLEVAVHNTEEYEVPPMISFGGENYVVSTNHSGPIKVRDDHETHTTFDEPKYRDGSFVIEVQRHNRYVYVTTKGLKDKPRAMPERKVRQYVRGFVSPNKVEAAGDEYVGYSKEDKTSY